MARVSGVKSSRDADDDDFDELEGMDLQSDNDDDEWTQRPTQRSRAEATSASRAAAARGSILDLDDDAFKVDVQNDFSQLTLKTDADSRPLTVLPNGTVLLEVFNPLYKQAQDFLVAVADPVARPQHIHEYKLTKYSLYAATSLGLQTNDILDALERLSKVVLDPTIREAVRKQTERCGKIKLVLKHQRYFIESIYPETLAGLMRLPAIYGACVPAAESLKTTGGNMTIDPNTGFLVSKVVVGNVIIPGTKAAARALGDAAPSEEKKDGMDVEEDEEEVEEVLELQQATLRQQRGHDVLSVEINTKDADVGASNLETVKKATSDYGYPMLEEYDFRKDVNAPDLPVALKPTTRVRSYQEKSLSKMFGNGRARSGIIVLPCGAGKTLVGLTAMTTIKKSTLVLCSTTVSVDQWKEQIDRWTTLPDKYVTKFTKDQKRPPSNREQATVLITTYSMLAYQVANKKDKQSKSSAEMTKFVVEHEWGLVILDEVQVAPANRFRQCMLHTKSKCKLGLTATLVREDFRIEDLYYLIGPKLYEANWLDLQEAGHIATVECIEVWCPMTSDFYEDYLNARSHAQGRLLYIMNPNKFRACELLIDTHEKNGDKVLVFSDNIFALELYAKALKKPAIHGGTSHQDRQFWLHKFQHDPKENCLFISKIGDNAIDLPDVNVIIQIASHFASRRQEAQRLGRILRPKPRTSSRYNAFFYTLVSKDTREMYYATKRQRFLVDQGYAFRVVPDMMDHVRAKEKEGFQYYLSSRKEEEKLLAHTLSQDDRTGETETLTSTGAVSKGSTRGTKASKGSAATAAAKMPTAVRTAGSMALLTGDDTLVYATADKPFGRKQESMQSDY